MRKFNENVGNSHEIMRRNHGSNHEEVHLNLEMNRNVKSWKSSESLNWILEYLIMVNFEKYLLKFLLLKIIIME